MRVLFHAPLKEPDHPVPSGDREMARGLCRLLVSLGARVVRSRAARVPPGTVPPDRALGSERRARAQADRLIRRWRALPAGHPERFDLWFTYHCYYRKPDWLGPLVCRALDVPYVIAEASHAPRRAQGPWRVGHRAVERALAVADRVITVNPNDLAGVTPRLRPRGRQVQLDPFVDTAPFALAARQRESHRAMLAARHSLDPAAPWLTAVAMMRARDKLSSYRVLGEALAQVLDRPWRLLVVGDGPARAEVESALAPLGDRVTLLGALPATNLPAVYAASDLHLWPAINEAYGMALLEAQAAGTPVIAGRTGGVPAVVADGATGLLVPVGDATSFAAAVRRLLDNPVERAGFGAAAATRAARIHDWRGAARSLSTVLRPLGCGLRLAP
ncbi:MAG: glycosyltransferase family 4 protein [Alphaproteobacteria bacterium]|nr:glycosyltransferase family 4 protein [Alphaproteobacteria bacterium]